MALTKLAESSLNADGQQLELQVKYCDACIQYGNDINNPVKHDPEECPKFGGHNRWVIQYGGIAPIEVLCEQTYKKAKNSPLRKPGFAITPDQEEIIKAHLNSNDINTAQEITLESIDQWSKDNLLTKGQHWSTGTIRTYFPEKGYGFIRPDCEGLDVWFHARERVELDYQPQEGDRVIYLTRLGEKGSLVARQLMSQTDYQEPIAPQNIYQMLYAQDQEGD